MKTSNKILLAAACLFLVVLFMYDYLVKKKYLSDNDRLPQKGYTALQFKDFDAADLPSSNQATVKFVQGPYSVQIDDQILKYVHIKQKGNRLKIEADFENLTNYSVPDYALIISLPKLTEINASAVSTGRDKELTIDSVVNERWDMGHSQVLIEGFKQDSISIEQSYGSMIIFSGDNIRSLNAKVGIKDRSGSKLVILKNNIINHANIEVLNRSHFQLGGAPIQNLEYRLADSARITYTGSGQSLMKTAKSRQE